MEKSFESRLSILNDPKSPQARRELKIVEYNSSIRSLVSKLDENILLIIKGHEADFLSAYRTIMNQIQTQMSKLRQTSDEQSVMVKNDQAVKNLQGNLAWYQNEAVRLSEACARLQSRYDKVIQKIEGYSIQNAYLEQQIKMLIRQNQTLKSHIKPEPVSSEETSTVFEEKIKESSTIKTLRSKFHINDANMLKDLERIIKNSEKKLNEKTLELDKQIKNTKNKLQEISSGQSKLFLRRNESEELFLECIDETRKEIIRKKSKAYSIKRAGTAKRENMLISEREKLVESFVTNEDIISFLYDKLFPWKNDKINNDPINSLGFSGKPIDREAKTQVPVPSSKQAVIINGKLLINNNM